MSRGAALIAALSAACARAPSPAPLAAAPRAQSSTTRPQTSPLLGQAPNTQAPLSERETYDKALAAALASSYEDRHAICSGENVDLAQLSKCACALGLPPTRDTEGNEWVPARAYCGAPYYPPPSGLAFALRGGSTSVAPGAELDLVAEVINPGDAPVGVVFTWPLWLASPFERHVRLLNAAGNNVKLEGCDQGSSGGGDYLIGIEPRGRATYPFRWRAATSIDADPRSGCRKKKWRPLPPGEYRLQVLFPIALGGPWTTSPIAEWKFRVVGGSAN